jgi:ferric-dicitrate binding protein FerR (iron transport regulator)
MSTHDRPTRPDNDSDEALRNLFAHAAPRPTPPEADAEEIRRAVYAEWDAVTGRRKVVRRAAGAAMAAAVVAGIVLFGLDTGTGPLPTVATIERVQGDVEIDGMEQLRIGAGVPQDAQLTTHSGQISLRLADGGSLRLASQTQLRLLASADVELRSGRLYFDSDGSAVSSKLAVRTEFGTLRDVGTQFIARLESDRLEIAVRDGRVALARGAENVAAVAGERVTVAQSSGTVRREEVDGYGADWEWAERLAPPFDIDGRQLIDFLTWFSHETGRKFVFADAQAERVARETVLTGSIDLEPMRKLSAVLALADLGFTVDGESIVIGAQ